jgi:hypothetical protein
MNGGGSVRSRHSVLDPAVARKSVLKLANEPSLGRYPASSDTLAKQLPLFVPQPRFGDRNLFKIRHRLQRFFIENLFEKGRHRVASEPVTLKIRSNFLRAPIDCDFPDYTKVMPNENPNIAKIAHNTRALSRQAASFSASIRTRGS